MHNENNKYHDDNLPGNPQWRTNDDQPFSRKYPLEIYVAKDTLADILRWQIATIESGRVPIIESQEETALADKVLDERRILLKWAEAYPDTHIFMQMSPHSEFVVEEEEEEEESFPFDDDLPPGTLLS